MSTSTPHLLPLLISELSSVKDELACLSVDVRDSIDAAYNDIASHVRTVATSARQCAIERDEAVTRCRQEETRRRALLDMVHELKGNIRVLCRIRPVLKSDTEKGQAEVVAIKSGRETVKLENKEYVFDHVFGPQATQHQVYEEVQPNIESVMEGLHTCIFAYGQTSSGKTHTMSGTVNDRGINYRAIETLFALRDSGMNTQSITKCRVTVSNVEIYNERVRDLLHEGATSPTWLEVRQDLEHGIHLPNCTWIEASTAQDVWNIMEFGQANRAQAHTNMNCESSRSHSVVMVEVDVWREEGSMSSCTRGRLVLVDLAGSERLSKSGATGERQKEAQNINKSLSALGDVISALGGKADHVPFRNSKLTFLLQDSMSNNNKVMMIVQVAPTIYNAAESICTLVFGSRARAVEMGRASVHHRGGGLISDVAATTAAAAAAASSRNTALEKKISELEKLLLEAKSVANTAEIRAKSAEAESAKLKAYVTSLQSVQKVTTTRLPALQPQPQPQLPPSLLAQPILTNTSRRSSLGGGGGSDSYSMVDATLPPPPPQQPRRPITIVEQSVPSSPATATFMPLPPPQRSLLGNNNIGSHMSSSSSLYHPSSQQHVAPTPARRPMRELSSNVNGGGGGGGPKRLHPPASAKKIVFGSRIDAPSRTVFGSSLGGASRVMLSGGGAGR